VDQHSLNQPPGSDEWDDASVTAWLSDLAPLGLLVTDGDLRVRWMNRTIMVMNGLSAADIGTKPLDVLLPGVPARTWDVIRDVLATGKPLVEVEVSGAIGPRLRPRVWRASYYPIHDQDGTPVAVGVASVDVTDLRRAEAGRAAMERRLRLLSRASGLIGASLDLTSTLSGMRELVVPEFADNWDLLLVDEPLDAASRPAHLIMRQVGGATTRSRPDTASAIPIPTGTQVRVGQDNPTYRALITCQPVLFEMDDRVMRSVDYPDRDRYFADLDVRTAIAVPLLVGRDFHGAVYFGLGASGRNYTPYDVQTAAELGSRIANAVANARAYARQRAAAVTLQRGLLPGDIPAVEGLELAWRYEPGGSPGQPPRRPPGPLTGTFAGAEVGGDWFDVIMLSAGRVALVIGDVMGRGLTAAAVMGQVRTAVRAFAALDLPAADVLTHVNDLVQAIGTGPDGALVSCVYAIFEPAAATVTIANAGHLPPALVSPDGTVSLLEGAGGIILGVTGQTLTESRHPFPPGTTLALYTDGLVESPTTGIDQGIRRLRAALAEPGELRPTADRLLTLIDRAGGYDDDVALLLVRATGPATVATWVLPPEPRAAKTARDATVATVARWQLTEQVDLVELLVSELVTNAIRYARGTPIHLTLRRATGALYVEVADGDSRVPRLLNPTADDEGGRGLQLVAELATHWGARPTRTGKTAWFQLDTGVTRR
jgi:serine phosphatase RsbU (regulator of sigma subunit)/PAS domain-containing protein/anti-sigma regulatory factor (Ser/Thr protein kinase)